jgi:AcrR family transcriptional regulator
MELIAEKGFDGITVKDLAERAGINRGTFYLHYLDIYDLLEKSKEEMLSGLKDIARQIELQDIIQHNSLEEPYAVLLRISEYFAEHAVFFKSILGPKGDPAYPLKLKQFMRDNLYEKLHKHTTDHKELLVPPDYLTAYTISANLGMIQYWLETGMALPPREFALMLTRIVRLGPLQSTGMKK